MYFCVEKFLGSYECISCKWVLKQLLFLCLGIILYFCLICGHHTSYLSYFWASYYYFYYFCASWKYFVLFLGLLLLFVLFLGILFYSVLLLYILFFASLTFCCHIYVHPIFGILYLGRPIIVVAYDQCVHQYGMAPTKRLCWAE